MFSVGEEFFLEEVVNQITQERLEIYLDLKRSKREEVNQRVIKFKNMGMCKKTCITIISQTLDQINREKEK